jgi:AraC-like DNA-binding protein/quercetin dioxygenase-like cupin family protein
MPVGNSIASQLISQSGHDGEIVVGEFDLPAGRRFGWHQHERHQLAWAASGVLSVTTAEGVWVLPPTRALWIPAGTRHVTAASTAAIVRSLYVRAGAGRARAHERGRAWPTAAIVVDDLLAALIGYLARADLAPPARTRAEAVVLDVIVPAPAAAIRVPMPRDARATALARRLSADPADDRDLPAWGREVGASARTLSRLFLDETGLSFGRWRTQLRMRAALIHLAAGTPVGAVARRVGYRTPSAFVAAFRQTLGAPPGTFFRQGDRPGESQARSMSRRRAGAGPESQG